MAITRNHLTAHEYFTVSNYILKHLEELRALRGNAERARQVGEALNMTLTIPNLEHSARTANVSLSPPPKPKAEASGEVAELIRALTERVEALEAHTRKTDLRFAAPEGRPHASPQYVPGGVASQLAPSVSYRNALL